MMKTYLPFGFITITSALLINYNNSDCPNIQLQNDVNLTEYVDSLGIFNNSK